MNTLNKNNEDITEDVTIVFTADEALILSEWLSNFNKKESPELFEDQAEQRVLFDLEAVLEKVMTVPFVSNYDECLAKARENVRDEV